LTILSSLPDHLVEHVRGFSHLGGVEHQVDVVVLRRDRRLERGDVNDTRGDDHFSAVGHGLFQSTIFAEKKIV
jgi:hypothetical protein